MPDGWRCLPQPGFSGVVLPQGWLPFSGHQQAGAARAWLVPQVGRRQVGNLRLVWGPRLATKWDAHERTSVERDPMKWSALEVLPLSRQVWMRFLQPQGNGVRVFWSGASINLWRHRDAKKIDSHEHKI